MRKIKMFLPRVSVSALLPLMLFIIAAATGCATFDDRDPRPPKLTLPEFSSTGMSKKVALALFDNRTPLRFEEVEQSFFLPLKNQITDDCDNIVLHTPYDSKFSEALLEATLATVKNDVDNMAIARIGRALGLSAVITGRLDNISGFEREKGFWFLKENQHYQRVLIRVAMYDVETGAKFLSENYSEEIEISNTEFAALATGTVANSPLVMKAFRELSENIADDICEILSDTPWIGFVTRVDKHVVTLSSGADVGLVPGKKLELYSSDKILTGPHGNRFYIPGTKSGGIEVVEVNPHSSRARLLPESAAGPGYAVRFR